MWLELFLTVGHACGALALVAIACGQVVRLSFAPNVTSLIQGLAFAVGALFTMLTPVDMGAVTIDGRTVFIGLAAAFVGLPGALLCAVAVAAFRLYAPEYPVAGELVSSITPLCLGLIWARFLKLSGTQFTSLTVLALCISATMLLFFFRYPPSVSVGIIASCWPPIFATAFVSAQVYGVLMRRELAQISREKVLTADASADPLTGVLNRRGFSERLESLLAYPGGISLLMIDADHFKAINDTYGHAAGDAWLVEFAQLALSVLPTKAVLARLGGEEFAAILVNHDEVQAAQTAEELRLAVQAMQVPHLDKTFGTTISIGLARSRSRSDVSLLQRADVALYFAKAKGRNTVAAVSRDGAPVGLSRMESPIAAHAVANTNFGPAPLQTAIP